MQKDLWILRYVTTSKLWFLKFNERNILFLGLTLRCFTEFEILFFFCLTQRRTVGTPNTAAVLIAKHSRMVLEKQVAEVSPLNT